MRHLYVLNMKQEYTIASNGTWLSLAQAQLLKDAIGLHFSTLTVNIITAQNEDADFSTNSLKTLTAAHLEATHHALIQRGDIRNIAIFNNNIIAKINAGEPLQVAIDEKLPHQLFEKFLQKGLPKISSTSINIQFVTIEDEIKNVLQNKHLDGCILPLASINDLMQYAPLQNEMSNIMAEKQCMLLPLFECPPLAGQGVVVATANSLNTDAIFILKKCNNSDIEATLKTETEFAATLTDAGNYGIFHLDTGTTKFSFSAGVDTKGNSFTNWDFETPNDLNNDFLFSSTDYMKDFFSYQYLNDVVIKEDTSSVFISSHKAIHSTELFNSITQKKVWAAGTRTWYELSKKGIWVAGCADGLGMESLTATWQSPFIHLAKKDFLIITNKSSRLHWKADDWYTAATYELIPEPSEAMQEAIGNASFIFWTSFQQYEMYKGFVKPTAKHLCPAGKTAKLLLAAGFTPVIFPTIKAFLYWRRNIHSW